MPRSLLVRRTVVSLGILAGLFLASGLAYSFLESRRTPPPKSTEEERGIAVRLESARRIDYVEHLTGYGRARALRRTTVAAEVAGLVTRVSPALEAGLAVAEGAPLVWLDDRDAKNRVESTGHKIERNASEGKSLEAERASLDAQLAIAQEELEIARREFERVEQLVARGVATSSARDVEALKVTMRRAAVTRLESDREKNEAQRASIAAERADLAVTLRQARLDLARTIVHAPYAGRIEDRAVHPGARVAPGTALFSLVDPARIEIPISLPASRFGEVAPGGDAEVRIPGAADAAWTASVVRVSPVVRADERTFDVYLESTGPEAVPPGAFVSARIRGRLYPGVFAIPRTAFVGDTVFVAEEGVARARKPHVRRSLPATVLCDGGIEEGDRLIVTNLEEVADGARIAPAGDPPEPDDA